MKTRDIGSRHGEAIRAAAAKASALGQKHAKASAQHISQGARAGAQHFAEGARAVGGYVAGFCRGLVGRSDTQARSFEGS